MTLPVTAPASPSASASPSAPVVPPRVGVWLIGARGSVAVTAVAGCAAVTAGLRPPTGLVTESAEFAGADLPPLSTLVFGGHDTLDCPLPKRAEALAAAGVLPPGLPAAVDAELVAAEREIRPGGPAPGDTRSPRQLIADFAADITDFTRRLGLRRTVVINVASTEPTATGDVLPPSSLYAAAALEAGCPYVNFTPSTGLHHPALAERLAASGLPYAGRDGKTGQTLLRSVLGPMFRQRALTVRAWSGTNLLGGGDGAALADPAAAAAKNAGKERVLADTLGTTPEGEVHIDDVPALGDWKTAWDHIAFDGFLGTRMILQTIWQGCDSALAAPLVLDLARLTSRAHEAGISGPLSELGFYFKDPVGDAPSSLADQYTDLLAFATRLGKAAGEHGERGDQGTGESGGSGEGEAGDRQAGHDGQGGHDKYVDRDRPDGSVGSPEPGGSRPVGDRAGEPR
ncbi:myo-inositol-1-phosphate synthase [Streptomyces griseoviridis]|uniref:Myo-inositol-1-phosphate synthase n=1 Tax=Streptomyces griseoviridis TaxID=45398 RepID=A0A3Q9KM68_STRGD|nr:inositol-3-phosphate synthase [Streptomyces griseoviridis]AZS83957.1 myo-inositol-1-phosphate synthase [Streptomyces griseoviridis]QCN89190.1 myo-inositol-1-phosphate synthase [Streptomyces griseoviridis]